MHKTLCIINTGSYKAKKKEEEKKVLSNIFNKNVSYINLNPTIHTVSVL